MWVQNCTGIRRPTCRPAYVQDNLSVTLVLITETDCVLYDVGAEVKYIVEHRTLRG